MDDKIQEAVTRHAQRDMAAAPNMANEPSASPPRAAPSQSTAPSTSSVLWAAWRQGLKDLQTAVLGDWGGTHEEMGTIGNPVPMEIYQDRHDESPRQDIDSYEHGLSMAVNRDQERGHTR